jgi:hypothetical protein
MGKMRRPARDRNPTNRRKQEENLIIDAGRRQAKRISSAWASYRRYIGTIGDENEGFLCPDRYGKA